MGKKPLSIMSPVCDGATARIFLANVSSVAVTPLRLSAPRYGELTWHRLLCKRAREASRRCQVIFSAKQSKVSRIPPGFFIFNLE